MMAGWPWVVSWCGDIDLIGQQKAPSLARDVVWGVSPLEMTVRRPVPEGMKEAVADWGWSDELQSWSWPGAEGKKLAVRVYSSAERVELLLNGTKVGEHSFTPADKMRAEFILPYAPGALEAVAISGGRVLGRRRLETVGAPARLRLAAERPSGRKGRQGLHYVTVEILDARGRLIPDEARAISISVEGPAKLVGFGGANPQAVGSFQAHEAPSFRGRALAILRSEGKSSTVRISAHCNGLPTTVAMVRLA